MGENPYWEAVARNERLCQRWGHRWTEARFEMLIPHDRLVCDRCGDMILPGEEETPDAP